MATERRRELGKPVPHLVAADGPHDVTPRNRRGADSRGGQALTGGKRPPTDGGRSAVAAGETAKSREKEVNKMLTKYKGWNIEYTGHGYALTRIEKVDGKTIEKRAKTQELAKTVITNEESRIAREKEAKAKAERERVITKRYRADLKDHAPVIFTLQRGPSGAFAYGNQTSVVFYEGETFRGIIDTRYDHIVIDDFDAWCIEYLKSYIDPKFEPRFTEA